MSRLSLAFIATCSLLPAVLAQEPVSQIQSVASAKTEFDSQVKAGHLSADQAAKIEANLTSMITNLVNGTLPHPNGGPGGHADGMGLEACG